MFSFLRKNDKRDAFPVKIFVVASLLSFFLLGGIMVMVVPGIFPQEPVAENTSRAENKLSTTTVPSNQDPFVTKVPRLEDALRGPITNGKDPDLGANDPEVTIVEFADYKCGVCQNQTQLLKKIKDEYGDKIKLIWKDYPSHDKNSSSFKAAKAARCAGEQDKFWSYNELLFQNSDQRLDRDLFLSLAEELNLNIYGFRDCLEGQEMSARIMDNIAEANDLGINGIPFIYVGDQEIMGEASYEEIKRLVETEIKR